VVTHVFAFIKDRGRNAQGDWYFCLAADGAPLHDGATSLYCAAFAIYGFTEYARATGSEEALALALETFRHAQRRLAQPGSYQTHPWPIPAGMKAHGVAMIFASAFDELGAFLREPEIDAAALEQAREVMEIFLHPERQRVYEFVRLDGTVMDEPPGPTVNPGHAIESMWFMIHLFQRRGDMERVRQCIEAMRWQLDLGWDEEYGGLFLALDAARSPWENKWDLKLWWPHTEALYALLLAHSLSGEAWCLAWFQRVHDYAFRHFPVPEHGEWIQNFDRQGRKVEGIVALPVKDPFHLARSLILSLGVLERLADETEAPAP
jgi:N-acylglucosamine 2-epimerase